MIILLYAVMSIRPERSLLNVIIVHMCKNILHYITVSKSPKLFNCFLWELTTMFHKNEPSDGIYNRCGFQTAISYVSLILVRYQRSIDQLKQFAKVHLRVVVYSVLHKLSTSSHRRSHWRQIFPEMNCIVPDISEGLVNNEIRVVYSHQTELFQVLGSSKELSEKMSIIQISKMEFHPATLVRRFTEANRGLRTTLQLNITLCKSGYQKKQPCH